MQIDIELKTIQYMLTIEQEGSFQKAAKALYISQPALSQYIRRTEETLSFPLYDRRNGRCLLTKPGKILLERGRKIMMDYQLMINEMKDVALVAREVYLGWPTGYTARYFTKLFTELSQNEDMELHIMEGSVERLVFLLLQGSLDIAFIPAVYTHPNLEYTTIHREEFCLAVPKAHKANQKIQELAVDGRVDLRELKDLPFVLVNAKPFTEFLENLFGIEGPLPNELLSCKDWDSAFQLTEQGVALTVVPYWYAEKPSTSVNFYGIRSAHKTYRTFACATCKDNPIDTEMQTVMEYVMRLYGDEYAGEMVEPESLTLPYSSSAKET